jgi:hypothetical protein
MGWYSKGGTRQRTSSSKSSFKSGGSRIVSRIVSHHNIDEEYQKCLQSAPDTNLAAVTINGIIVNPGDNFTYKVEFSIFQRFLSEFGCSDCFKPKNIYIYRNGVYDHDIIPTRIANVIGYYRHGVCYEAKDYCKNLNKVAGNAVDTHRYDIRRRGNYYAIKFHPCGGWANEGEYEYDTLTDCLKHIVVNSTAYNDTELSYELSYLNSCGCIINSVTIENKAELKRYIQNNIRLPYQI